VPLAELRATRGLEEMVVLQRGSRLSITPLTPAEWKITLRLTQTAG
jgi:predicted RNA-binding protein with PUA-like domain